MGKTEDCKNPRLEIQISPDLFDYIAPRLFRRLARNAISISVVNKQSVYSAKYKIE